MPNIRIMNWNIEQLSWNKIRIGNIPQAIAHVVVDQRVDILVILELKTVNVNNILNRLMTAINARATAVGGFGANDYTTAVLSRATGGDYYGFIIRDPAVTNPIFQTGGPVAGPIQDMTACQFRSMAHLGRPAGTAAAPVVLSTFPLIDLHATQPPAGRRQARFPGQPIAVGGNNLGRGYRLPCLAMFRVAAAGNPIIPIIPCHYGANRSAYTYNAIASGQVAMLRYLHIAQIYKNINGNHINLNGATARIENIIITGDFNIDFLQNTPGGVYPAPGINFAYLTLTARIANGGTGVAAAAAAPPTGVAAVAAPLPATPAMTTSAITANPNYPLNLRTAVTNEGTILHHYDPNNAQMSLPGLRGPCYDNFFFGGTHLEPHVQMLPAPAHMPAVANADCALVVDVPSMIKRQGDPAAGIDVLTTAAWYAAPPASKNAHLAPELQVTHAAATLAAAPAPPAPLTPDDRLIGARLISDHLPVVVQFNLP
jgi:hypothetical protein